MAQCATCKGQKTVIVSARFWQKEGSVAQDAAPKDQKAVDVAIQVTCPACQGTGETGNPDACPRCNGSTTTIVNLGGINVQVRCPECSSLTVI